MQHCLHCTHRSRDDEESARRKQRKTRQRHGQETTRRSPIMHTLNEEECKQQTFSHTDETHTTSNWYCAMTMATNDPMNGNINDSDPDSVHVLFPKHPCNGAACKAYLEAIGGCNTLCASYACFHIYVCVMRNA